MSALLLTCKHCNGTTFCSARREATGTVKLRPACQSCLVKSGLDPNGIFEKVVCSVCGGRGVVEPQPSPAEQARRRRTSWLTYAIVVPVIVVCLTFAVMSAVAIYREQHRYDDPASLVMDDMNGTAADLTKADLLGLITPGMSKSKVRDVAGEPDSIKESKEGIDVWAYRCKDGRVLVTFTNEVVYSRYTGK
jgi:hypothetical protein